MATTRQPHDPQRSINETQETTPNNDIEVQQTPEGLEIEVFDYLKRAQWLRAAVLGANDGLLSTALLMMGVGAARTDVKSMILSGTAGLVGGACSMAIGEFVSVSSQYDIEVTQMKRENGATQTELEDNKKLPNPLQAAAASASAFAAGAALPLLGAAFIKDYHARLGVVVGVVNFALPGFGSFGAYLGGTPMVKSSLRILIGGWLAMGITFGLTKLIGSTGL